MELHCVVRRDIALLTQRKCNLSDATLKPSSFVDIKSNPELASKFTQLQTRDISTQCTSCDVSAIEVNTDSAICDSRGINHKEGGWPRDINPLEADQMARYRKKVEKDEAFGRSVIQLGQLAEHYIKQNNIFSIYEEYFIDAPNVTNPDRNPLRTLHYLKDPSRDPRPITGLSWSPDGGIRLAAAYSNPLWSNLFEEKENESYIWNMEKAFRPEVTIRSNSQLCSVSFNPRDQNCLAGGSINGCVAIWDVRKGSAPAESTPIDVGHRESVSSLVWSNSKAGGEFFSTAPDGKVLWWDMRKLSASIDVLYLDPEQNPDSALSASCMEYDPSMPNKFLVGTQQGLVLSCNRRARIAAERIMSQFEAHLGPVNTLHRHPQLPKIFLTVGDWTTHIWTEDIKDSPILTLRNHNIQLLTGAWSCTRPSVIFTAGYDGSIYLWDILAQRTNPVLSFQISDFPLTSLSTQEQGKIMAVGSGNGGLSIIQISESLSSASRNDRTSLTSLLERECRREKTLESRSKDNKANKDRLNRSNAAIATSSNNTEDNKTPMFLFEPPTDAPADAPALSHIASEIGDDQLRVAEELFFDIIHQDILSRRRQSEEE